MRARLRRSGFQARGARHHERVDHEEGLAGVVLEVQQFAAWTDIKSE